MSICGECSEMLNCDCDSSYGHRNGLCWTDADDDYDEDYDEDYYKYDEFDNMGDPISGFELLLDRGFD